MSAPIVVPPIQEEFISDAWNTLDPKPTAEEIAELWCDQQINVEITYVEYDKCVKKIAKQVAWYLPE
jgi:hypothetical protein